MTTKDKILACITAAGGANELYQEAERLLVTGPAFQDEILAGGTCKDPDKHFSTLLSAMWGGGLHLLNTSIVPPGADGRWVIETIPAEWAKSLVRGLCHDGSGWPVNHIGHSATAAVAGEIFRLGKLEPDRTPWDGKGLGLALQLRGRIAEGAILTREEMEKLGYDLRVLYRVADDGLPVDAFRPGLRSAKDAEALRSVLCGSGVKVLFVRRKPSRTGGHVYYGAAVQGYPDFEAGKAIVSVLSDPLKHTEEPLTLGYSGSAMKPGADYHDTVMVWVGEKAGEISEHIALDNLTRQIAVAIGWTEDRIIPWEVL